MDQMDLQNQVEQDAEMDIALNQYDYENWNKRNNNLLGIHLQIYQRHYYKRY